MLRGRSASAWSEAWELDCSSIFKKKYHALLVDGALHHEKIDYDPCYPSLQFFTCINTLLSSFHFTKHIHPTSLETTDHKIYIKQPHFVLNSITFGMSTSQRVYAEQHTPKIGWKLHKYGLKHALHTLDDHFR